MASIVSSIILEDNPQIDTRRIIREQHTDDKGNLFTFDYMVDKDFDVASKMNARIPEVLAEAELLQAGA